MPITTHSLQLFGLDLGRMWQASAELLQHLHQGPALAWLTPDLPVRLLRADGSLAYWQGARALKTPPKTVRFEAIEISEDLLLRKTLSLPPMPPEQTLQALALQARESSPFAPEELVWSYRVLESGSPTPRAELILGARSQLQTFIDAQQTRRGLPEQAAEVWAMSVDGVPIVLPGWGENARQQAAQTRRHGAYALLAFAAGLAVAIAITPTAQLRLRALEAITAYESMAQKTAPIVGQREAYMQSIERLEAVRSLLAQRTDTMRLLETLTAAIADDTFIHNMKVQGLKVTLQGLTPNAPKLMQLLGNVPGIREVKAPSAAVRNPGATADNFLIELQLDPALLSQAPPPLTAPTPTDAPPSASSPEPVASAAVPAPSAPPAVASPAPSINLQPPPPAPAPAPAAVAPTTAPAAPAAAISAPAPRKSRFSSGGD